MTGFGINSNILDTNIINLIVVLGIVFYFGRDFLISLLDSRQKTILANLQDADVKYNTLVETLNKAEEQLKAAQAQAETIRTQSRVTIQQNVEGNFDQHLGTDPISNQISNQMVHQISIKNQPIWDQTNL